MTLSPPYLVIRKGISFWVETRPVNSVSATLQAFEEGCYSGAVCYDSSGNLWPVEHAVLRVRPSFVYKLFPWRQLLVELRLGVQAAVEVADIIALLEAILRSDSKLDGHLRESSEVNMEHLKGVRTAQELIEAAAKIE
jgi:hypothetical protein